MKWYKKQRPPAPKIGDTRGVRRFLILPLTIGNEARWLEWCEYTEIFHEVTRYIHGTAVQYKTGIWIPKAFISA